MQCGMNSRIGYNFRNGIFSMKKLLRYNAYVCSKCGERPKEFLQVKFFFGANNLHWAETSNFSLVLNNGADDYR